MPTGILARIVTRSAGQPDQRELAPVGRLAAMRGAAVGEEAGLVGISVEAERLDRADPRRAQARGDVAFEIELPVARAAGGEEALVVGGEVLAEARVDLVARLRDRRADRGGDPRRARAPSRSIAATVFSITPPCAPRQPACAAPITPASRSASSTGAQSAVTTPSSRPGRSVTIASARGRSSCGQGSRTSTASGEWTW